MTVGHPGGFFVVPKKKKDPFYIFSDEYYSKLKTCIHCHKRSNRLVPQHALAVAEMVLLPRAHAHTL